MKQCVQNLSQVVLLQKNEHSIDDYYTIFKNIYDVYKKGKCVSLKLKKKGHKLYTHYDYIYV